VVIKGVAVLLLGVVIGIVLMIFFYQPLYQGKTAKEWAAQSDIITKVNSKKLSDLNKKYSSVSATLQMLLNAPSPTPKVQYIDKNPSRPNLSSCNLEGNFYFCPTDNCYYNPNGTPTGACKIPPMADF
jgi:hypothetical protein